LVAQGISNYIAVKSKIFHSYQIKDLGLEEINSVIYDANLIKKSIQDLIVQEIGFEKYLNSYHVDPVRIYYEDIVEEPKKNLNAFCECHECLVAKRISTADQCESN
jgi:LPS sulfotransferase NodH